jgi:hypothetical protein
LEFIRVVIFFVLACRLCFMVFRSIAPLGVLSHLISKKRVLVFIERGARKRVIIFKILQKGRICVLNHIFKVKKLVCRIFIVVKYDVITSLIAINIIGLTWLLDLFLFAVVTQGVISLLKIKLEHKLVEIYLLRKNKLRDGLQLRFSVLKLLLVLRQKVFVLLMYFLVHSHILPELFKLVHFGFHSLEFLNRIRVLEF